MKITDKQIIVAIVTLVVGYFLVTRFFLKPKPKEVPKTQDIVAELKGMKINALKTGTYELYRSDNNTGHTIAGTILEQAINVIVAVLEQPDVVKVGNSLIASKEDADNVATMIEEVGKDVTKSIKDTPADKFVQDGPNIAYKALQNSLKDEVDKTDTWVPIAQRFVDAHGSKHPFKMNDDDKNRIKNASPGEIESLRDAIKKTIDDDFGTRRRVIVSSVSPT